VDAAVAAVGRRAIAGRGHWVLAGVGGGRNAAASGGRRLSRRREGGRRVREGVFNADLATLVRFLAVGTRFDVDRAHA
jgi:hypothetical protein